ncbi:HD domain-containing protein [Rubinisphaera margarita]|uniref:HD domain-containing protein n=1 Tax=Rubinisphaera margarita TaxID=2909586 RepID=UPI001EE7FBA6|nr:HD domain-containing protein [Rubinisphaera margarita]MCG6158450.1 HD domain-containing protein [Rubinisphaera margarita]
MTRRRRTTDDPQQLRERIAREAARLIARRKVKTFHTARMRAMRWLSQQRLTSSEIPTQEEVMRELERLTASSDWDRQSNVQWLLDEAAIWVEPLNPLLWIDWQAVGRGEEIVGHWVLAAETDPEVQQILQSQTIGTQPSHAPEWAVAALNFSNGIPHRIYFDASLDAAAAPEKIERVVGSQPERFTRPVIATPVEDDEDSAIELSWGDQFRPLLESLADFTFNSEDHPEGDALYHSLQVYQLGRELHPYDVEFQWACLLHDIGYVVDARTPCEAALRVLEGRVTERVEFLVGNLEAGHQFLNGGSQAKSLRKSEDFGELLDLARCDRNGRQRGQSVPTLDEALAELEELEQFGEES